MILKKFLHRHKPKNRDNNRKNQHYYQYIKEKGKIIKTIKHRVDHTQMG